MEQILDVGMTMLRVLLAGFFALAPGTIIWLTVLGVYLAIRQVLHRPEPGATQPA
jgi:hypothetical protein